jgi:hypothetical protein
MPGPSATLFNHDTNTYEEVPAERVNDAISSGRYTATGASTETQALGGTVVRPLAQMGAAGIQGESPAEGVSALRAAGARREEQVSANSDKVLSFVEGAGDALTLGLMHGTSQEDELRREADSGAALLGQLVGTAAGLAFPGPIKGATAGGEALGRGIARALLGEVETGFRGVVTRGLAEAGANASLMAASAFGHQITDAVIADKPFAAEGIASEAGVGALLGFGAGFAGSAFGKLAKASRGAVEASGIAVKESRAALDAVADLTRNWDDVVEQHAQRVGVLNVLSEEGHIPNDFAGVRTSALRDAEKARDALRAIDPERAFSGESKPYQSWRDAVERYQTAVDRLDESMTPSPLERAHANKVTPGSLDDVYKPPVAPVDMDAAMADKGFRSPLSSELDKGMQGAGSDWTHLKGASGEELRAKYRDIYGRDFEGTPGVHSGTTGEENLGGKQTATSEAGTNPGVRRRPSPQGGPLVPVSEGGVPGAPAADTVVDARLDRFERSPAKARAPRDTVIDASGQTVGPRQVLRAGEPPAIAAETGADFVNAANREAERAAPAGTGEIPSNIPAGSGEGKKAVRDYLNNWFREFDAKPRVGIGDQLKVRLTEALDSISRVGGSRLDSAGSLGLLESLKIREASSPLGQRLDQVWSMGQAGKFAADEARGVKTPLRTGLAASLKRYAARAGGRAIGGAVLGGAVGGPAGAILGMALTSAGFAGNAAATAGKLMKQISLVGEALLKGTRATMAVRAVAGNRPYQYDDTGPIKDPVQRLMAVQRMAANPQAIRARVAKQLGDLNLTSPEIAQHLAETTVNHVTAIAASGPAVMMTPLGQPIKPSGTAMQRFFDFENAMHDLPALLAAVANGTANDAQLKALRIGYPAVHAELVRNVLGQEQRMDSLETAKLKSMERVLGVPLTRASAEPLLTARLQSNWEAPKPAPKPAQAFKITATKPTPAQSASGDRAPGNERKP